MVIIYLPTYVTLFSQSVKLTDVNSRTVRAVHPSPNTYHAIFPEITLALSSTD